MKMHYIKEYDFFVDDNSDKNIKTVDNCSHISKYGFFGINRSDINNIVEIGSNIGYYTKNLGIYYKNAIIFSFEPCQKTYKILEKNISQIPNVKT